MGGSDKATVVTKMRFIAGLSSDPSLHLSAGQ